MQLDRVRSLTYKKFQDCSRTPTCFTGTLS